MIMKLSKREIFTTVCGLTSVTFIVGLVAFGMGKGSFKVTNLNEFGDFYSGILAPLFSFITIWILLMDKQELEQKDQITTSLRMYEYIKKILKGKEEELQYEVANFITNRTTPLIKGFGVITYFREHERDLSDDLHYVFEWAEEYAKRLRYLFDLMNSDAQLREVIFFDFVDPLYGLRKFSITYSRLREIGYLDNHPRIKETVTRLEEHLIAIDPNKYEQERRVI